MVPVVGVEVEAIGGPIARVGSRGLGNSYPTNGPHDRY